VRKKIKARGWGGGVGKKKRDFIKKKVKKNSGGKKGDGWKKRLEELKKCSLNERVERTHERKGAKRGKPREKKNRQSGNVCASHWKRTENEGWEER